MAAGRGAATERTAFEKRYLSALRTHLDPLKEPAAGSANRLGNRACELGIETLDLARIHESAVVALDPPAPGKGRSRRSQGARAASFFTEALAPIAAASQRVLAEQHAFEKTLARGTADLASSRKKLSESMGHGRTVQKALDKSDRRHLALQGRNSAMEEELRLLSRSLLVSHEEERRRISRELHDTLGQTLAAVNLDLASMLAIAANDSKEFRSSVSRTQRLIRESLRTVHGFAMSLRPTLLDDLGLVPALLAFSRDFGKKNGISVQFSSPELPAWLGPDARTAFFRIVQESLVNVGRHARASNVRITLRKLSDGIRLDVWNDGRTFDVARVIRSATNRHLGLLCMRERMEMVGGTFEITSSPARGTRVRVFTPIPVKSGE